MAQQRKVGTHCTTVATVDGWLTVTYHQTAIVRANQDEIILDHGGWDTSTTKTRMNQASNQHELGYQVFQKKGRWYVEHNGITHEFLGNSVTLSRKPIDSTLKAAVDSGSMAIISC